MVIFTPEEVTAATGGKRARVNPSASLGAGLAPSAFAGVSIDSRTVQAGDLFIAIRGRRFDGHDFVEEALSRGAAGAVVEHKWCQAPKAENFIKVSSKRCQAPVLWKVPDTRSALGALARFHRERFRLEVVAITGSSGKTTTKRMLAELLSADREILATPGTQNNLIGVPLTLLRLTKEHQAAVLELGTNRWGEIRQLTSLTRPTLGVVTNVGPAHLESFGDTQGVLRAKGELWEAMDSGMRLLLNADDPLLLEAGRRLPHRVVWFSATERGGPANVFGGGFGPEADLKVSRAEWGWWGSRCLINGRWELKVPLPGKHHLLNALAALTCAKLLGLELSLGIERLSALTHLPGRLSLIQLDGLHLIDDSYNANPDSLQAALEVLASVPCRGRRIVAMGDMLELGDQAEELHVKAGQRIAGLRVDFLIAVGPLARRLLEAAWAAGLGPEAGRAFETAEEAGWFLTELVRPGDAVLVKGSRAVQMERVIPCFTTSSTP